jgi:hypothetical protein
VGRIDEASGGEYDRADNFVQKAKTALRKIQAVYPALKLSYAKGGLVLHPSRTAIAPAELQMTRLGIPFSPEIRA